MSDGIKPFSFDTPGSMLVEWGGAKRIGELLSGWFGERNLLIVTDKFLHQAGVLDPAKASLAQAGFTVTVFDDVVADPPEAVLMACVEAGKAASADIVMGLGGGSSMDIAKLVAVMLVSQQELSQLYGIGKVTGKRAPLVQVPTTAGTGSEVTNITILTTGATTKMGVVSHQLYADRVLLDAELTVGLPAIQTAATGIDAMVHAIEAYTSKRLKNPLSDMLAREALRLLGGNIHEACRNGGNLKARHHMLYGSMLAGMAFANAPVAAVHALAYPVGARFHVPHGLSNSLVLPQVVRFNAPHAEQHYSELAEILTPHAKGGTTERTRVLVEMLSNLPVELGLPTRLRDVGIAEKDLKGLADDAMNQTRLLINNPREVLHADALAIYGASL